MTQTIRRELRLKFQDILIEWNKTHNVIFEYDILSNTLVDAALEVRGMAKIGIENKIVAGLPVTDEDLQTEKLKDDAIQAFERGLNIEQHWPWWTSRKWEIFSKWVVAKYVEDSKCFDGYSEWRLTPFVKGALSNGAIYGDIGDRLMAAGWSDYKATHKPQEPERPEYKKFVDPREGLEIVSPKDVK